jgi:hypothetical protein
MCESEASFRYASSLVFDGVFDAEKTKATSDAFRSLASGSDWHRPWTSEERQALEETADRMDGDTKVRMGVFE